MARRFHPFHLFAVGAILAISPWEPQVNMASAVETPEYKIVCYFTSWAFYRGGDGKFLPGDVDPSLCTHINYAFAFLDSTSLKMVVSDPWADLDNQFYKKVNDLKVVNPKLKVLLSLGGWTDSGSDKYSRLCASAADRKAFVTDSVAFLKRYGFDGLDIDWEYPNCPQGNCGSSPKDKANFVLLLQELNASFKQQKPALQLSIAMSANVNVMKQAYDVPNVFKHLDFANLMAYDYYGSWSPKTGHHSPLQTAYGETDPTASVENSVDGLLALGAPADKVVLGVPFYGRTFTLSDPAQNQAGAPAKGAGKAGKSTAEPGSLSYYEICTTLKTPGWTTMMDKRAGPYSFSRDQWIGFDGPRSLVKKANFVKARGLAGIMAWELSMDDFKGLCGTKYPLLTAVNKAFKADAATPSG
ncbi:unnamed protein product [Ixodes hexagonus]